MGLFFRSRAVTKSTEAVVTTDAAPMTVISLTPSAAPSAEESPADRDDASDVFVCEREPATPASPAAEVDPSVTLIVTGWHNVEPGPLAWPFPSMRSALDAVRKMKNAVEWSIVLGRDYESVEEARARGAVLIEQRS
jgi:hypothetical protein